MITCVVKNAATKNHQVSSVTDNSYHNCMDHSNGLPFWVCAAQAVQPGPSDLYLELVLKRIAKSVFVRRLLLPFLWGGPWESSETKWATWWELPGKDLPIAGIRRCLSTVVFFFFFLFGDITEVLHDGVRLFVSNDGWCWKHIWNLRSLLKIRRALGTIRSCSYSNHVFALYLSIFSSMLPSPACFR